jgi:hypothetical protein
LAYMDNMDGHECAKTSASMEGSGEPQGCPVCVLGTV